MIDFGSNKERVSRLDLEKFEKCIDVGDIILLKTKNSLLKETDSFDTGFVFLDHSGAQYLCEKKVKAVGIDYLGIENSSHQKNHETHSELMEAGVVIIEGLSMCSIAQLTH